MPTTFRPYQPDQLLLLSPDLREWLPPGHLAHHVCDLVDALELRAFYAPYEGDGRRNAPYEPSMMVKVLIYAYATGVFSSRAIARKLEEDVAFRVLAAGNFPQHRTICEFRRRHLEDFERMFVEVVRVAREMGVVRFGTLSVDGTKVRANASKRKAMSYGRMLQEEARLKEEIEGLLERADAVDGEEDERYGEEMRGDELPAELQRREKRLAAIAAAKARLEAAQRAGDDARGRTPGQGRNPKGGRPYKRAYGEPEPKAQSNFTDPESRIMNTSTEGFQQCYNAQTAVDLPGAARSMTPAPAGYRRPVSHSRWAGQALRVWSSRCPNGLASESLPQRVAHLIRARRVSHRHRPRLARAHGVALRHLPRRTAPRIAHLARDARPRLAALPALVGQPRLGKRAAVRQPLPIERRRLAGLGSAALLRVTEHVCDLLPRQPPLAQPVRHSSSGKVGWSP